MTFSYPGLRCQLRGLSKSSGSLLYLRPLAKWDKNKAILNAFTLLFFTLAKAFWEKVKVETSDNM